jgi:PKD repeat protein
MTDIGIKTELHDFVGYGHEPWLLAPQLVDTCYVYEIPFLYSVLRPKPLTITGDSILCLNDQGSYSVRNDAGATYCWDVTGGNIVTNTNNAITVQWTSVGTHIIRVRELTRDQVNGDLDSFTVNVISQPIAAFGDSVFHTQATFSDSSIGAISWSYNFGDNSNAQIPNPTHSYLYQDSFTVRLIVNNGYCADTTYRSLITDTCPSGLYISYTVSGDTVTFTSSPAGVGYSWHFGDGDSSDNTSPNHIFTHSQNYLVSLYTTTGNECTVYGSAIIPFKAVPTGIGEINADAINIYPNPTDGMVHISPVHESTHIAIYDPTGKRIWEKSLDANADISFDMSALSSGIYFVAINSENVNLTRKLIKQ